MKIISGDIGGTKTLLQLSDASNAEILAEQRYVSGDYASFDDVIGDFVNQHCQNMPISAACFGVAGPVITDSNGQTASITNLPWQMDSNALATQFNLNRVRLINDFEAVGYGIDDLPESELVCLQKGEAQAGANQLVIGAGTGLGVAYRIWQNGQYRVIPTEGGHIDYAPSDEVQLEFAKFLINKYGRSSMEFVLSGPGLANCYDFIANYESCADIAEVKQVLSAADPAAAVAALAGESRLADEALNLFINCYGTQAGNFALASMALGGVYIAGGIAPRMEERLHGDLFKAGFNRKGKMASLMNHIPIKLVMNTQVGLIGSRIVATRLANQ